MLLEKIGLQRYMNYPFKTLQSKLLLLYIHYNHIRCEEHIGHWVGMFQKNTLPPTKLDNVTIKQCCKFILQPNMQFFYEQMNTLWDPLCVTTLTLGSQPKQGVAGVWVKKKT
jgi:hypothetical protein